MRIMADNTAVSCSTSAYSISRAAATLQIIEVLRITFHSFCIGRIFVVSRCSQKSQLAPQLFEPYQPKSRRIIAAYYVLW